MSIDSTDLQHNSLGQYIRSTRLELGFDLHSIADDTKISRNVLMAIEAEEYEKLPPEAFAKGFYKIYARKLGLDPQTIAKRYEQERPAITTCRYRDSILPHYIDFEASEMARRPSHLTSTLFGLGLFMIMLFGSFACWYFSWNPASYLSQKLRGIEQTEQTAEQVQTTNNRTQGKGNLYDVIYLGEKPTKSGFDLLRFSSPRQALAGVIEEEISSQTLPKNLQSRSSQQKKEIILQ